MASLETPIVSSPKSTTEDLPPDSIETEPLHSERNEEYPLRGIRKRTTGTQVTTAPSTSRSSLDRQNSRRGSRKQSMFVPEKKVGPAPGVLASFKAIVLSSWLNVLLVFIPVSWALNFALKDNIQNKDTIVFVTSFLAIIPLAKLLAFATDELSLRVGQTLAGLLNATLGNAVELIVAIIALIKCELRVVQSSLVGSILSNLLLVLGMCFFAGGLKYSQQGFGGSATQLNSSLLAISVIAVLLPAAFHASFVGTDAVEGADILAVSRGVAIILLFIYGGYLVFQLYSHKALYDDHGEYVLKTIDYSPRTKPRRSIKFKIPFGRREGEVEAAQPQVEPQVDSNTTVNNMEQGEPKDEEEEEEVPQMNVLMSIILLAVVTVLVAVTAEWLVGSINGLTEGGHISKEFVGIILLPIVGNAAEHVTAVTVSVKDKLTLSLGVAVGSSIQIALFVIPFIITLAWILGKPLTLLFDPYESVTLFLAVITVNYVVQDARSNWLEGMILMCLYLIIGVTFWFYPGSDPSGLLAECH